MSVRQIVEQALDQGKGILHLAPAWVPRAFCIPGRRLKLHPEDYYSFGANRGGIDERWFASTVKADNGPLTTPDEGLSYVVVRNGGRIDKALFKDALAEAGAEIVGPKMMQEHGGWPIFAKFFDNKGALPHHLHQMPEHAANVGAQTKPEAYYFPVQLNNYGADYPYTFFGLNPGTTKEQVIECLKNWNIGDNKITSLSKAHKLEPGTGWDVPPGVLHAPGSLLTYEPQWASDVFAMMQSLVGNVPVPRELLVKDVPPDKHEDYDYLVSMLDWELNVEPDFAKNRFMRPNPVRAVAEMEAEGFIENWIAYRSKDFCAKELTVLPGRTITIKDSACYGFIMVQGHGTMGPCRIEAPTLIRFGQLTNDEFFVAEKAAKEGVKITNASETEPLVMLKHFGPGNADLKI
jgi:hypothetical protein